MALAMDDSHSVTFSNEHGVCHLILFHAHDADKNALTGVSSAESGEESHEFHLSTSAGLPQKKLQFSIIISKDSSSLNDYTVVPAKNTVAGSTVLELDVGSIDPPLPVLRI